MGDCCKLHEQLGQLFDIVKQLSPTAWNCQAGFHPDDRSQNGMFPLRLFDLGIERGVPANVSLGWGIVASFMNSWGQLFDIVQK